MVQSDLINLLNSGEAIAIIGSGISTDAGLPSWVELFGAYIDHIVPAHPEANGLRAVDLTKRIPAAFEKLAEITSQREIHDFTKGLYGGSSPGQLHRDLYEWPFKFFVTTNYDHLLEKESRGSLIAIGNQGREIVKLAPESRDIVWHIHGSCDLQEEKNRIVLLESDYDNYYPNSPLTEVLGGRTSGRIDVFLSDLDSMTLTF